MTQDTITITYAQLKAKRACAGQLAFFKKRFGNAVTVTRDDAGDKARGFNIDWLAKVLLSAPLWAEYERQRGVLSAEYERQCAAMGDECERQRAQRWAKYERQRAIVFFDLYATQLETGQ
jgi:hypothetical protein